MTKYRIDFEKLKNSEINGISFTKGDHDLYTPYPIISIDESIEEHIVQILYILKEKFTRAFYKNNSGFKGWNLFSYHELVNYINEDRKIYEDHFDDILINGRLFKFVDLFPEKINYFINNYCIMEETDKRKTNKILENNIRKRIKR